MDPHASWILKFSTTGLPRTLTKNPSLGYGVEYFTSLENSLSSRTARDESRWCISQINDLLHVWVLGNQVWALRDAYQPKTRLSGFRSNLRQDTPRIQSLHSRHGEYPYTEIETHTAKLVSEKVDWEKSWSRRVSNYVTSSESRILHVKDLDALDILPRVSFDRITAQSWRPLSDRWTDAEKDYWHFVVCIMPFRWRECEKSLKRMILSQRLRHKKCEIISSNKDEE